MHALPLATSQDHKRLLDGDAGPNTGGMGAYSPAPLVTQALHERIMREVIYPTIRGLAADGTPYTGFLYAGLMIAADGTPNVLEYNCRFGDPETQPVLSRLRSDLTQLCLAAPAGRLDRVPAEWDARAALGIVLAAAGYPNTVRTGDVIHGLEAAAALPGKVFHAATRAAHSGVVTTSGGRVLCAVGLGDTVARGTAAGRDSRRRSSTGRACSTAATSGTARSPGSARSSRGRTVPGRAGGCWPAPDCSPSPSRDSVRPPSNPHRR